MLLSVSENTECLAAETAFASDLLHGGSEASCALAERGVGVLGVEGLYELSQQPSLLCAGAQHLPAVALVLSCKKFCQHLMAVTPDTPCLVCACQLCDLPGSSSSLQLHLSVLSLVQAPSANWHWKLCGTRAACCQKTLSSFLRSPETTL